MLLKKKKKLFSLRFYYSKTDWWNSTDILSAPTSSAFSQYWTEASHFPSFAAFSDEKEPANCENKIKIHESFLFWFYSYICTSKRTISFEWIIQKTSFNTSIILHFNVYDKSNTCTWIVSFCCNRIIMIKSSLANSLKEIKAINQIFIEKKMNKYLGFLTIRTLWKESKRIQCP